MKTGGDGGGGGGVQSTPREVVNRYNIKSVQRFVSMFEDQKLNGCC